MVEEAGREDGEDRREGRRRSSAPREEGILRGT